MATADFHHKGDVDLYSPPSSRPAQTKVAKFLTAGAVSTMLLGLTGLTLTGTVMALIVATPFLVLLSPVLVPATIVMFLAAAGFVFSGGCGMAAIAALAWWYKLVRTYLTMRLHARREKARDYSYGAYTYVISLLSGVLYIKINVYMPMPAKLNYGSSLL